MAEVINPIIVPESMPADEPQKEKKGILSFFKSKGKKKPEIIIAVVLLIVIAVIYFSTVFSSSKTPETAAVLTYDEYCDSIETKLNKALASIKGAGKVVAVINFESSAEIIIAYNETINKNGSTDSSGKYNENSQSTKTTVLVNSNGNQIPIILKTVYPKVKGVLVSCQGAGDARIRNEVINSVSTLLAISPGIVYVTIMDSKAK